MNGDWRSVVRAAGWRVSNDDSIVVELGGSAQRIEFSMDDDGHALRAHSVVASPSTLRDAAEGESPYRYAWERNRLSDLIGFTVDGRGRLIGETWIPMEGIAVNELRFYVSELARLCDWHEFRLAGRDEY